MQNLYVVRPTGYEEAYLQDLFRLKDLHFDASAKVGGVNIGVSRLQNLLRLKDLHFDASAKVGGVNIGVSRLQNLSTMSLTDWLALEKKDFQDHDLNHDGFVTKQEIAEYFKRKGVAFSTQQIDYMFTLIGKNMTGKVTFKDVCEYDAKQDPLKMSLCASQMLLI